MVSLLIESPAYYDLGVGGSGELVFENDIRKTEYLPCLSVGL